MGHDYIQIPPDSTGKKVRHTTRIDIEIISVLVDLDQFDRGDAIIGLTNGATAKFLGFHVELGETYLYVKPETGTFVNGEQISINGITSATIDNFAEQNTQNIVLTDADESHHRLKVDNQGSAYVRYSEGDLGFDAFGHAQFSQASKVADWIFTYGDHINDFYDDAIIGGAITSSVIDSSMLFSTNTTSGSRITRTSHQYYPYNPGEGNELLVSYRSGDVGKENVTRRWGLFDDEDGLFFELEGTTFKVGIRSSTSGTPVETYVSQSQFNGDALDSANISHYVIDFSKYNIYWIDYQWLGVGKVRFGTFAPDGKRITMHTFRNPNALAVPYMRRGSLPLRIEQFNTAVPASSSESRLVCASLLRQNQDSEYPGHYYTFNSETIAVSGSFIPIISAKPNILHNGEINRSTFIPVTFEVYVDGDPIRLDVIENPTLSGDTFIESGSVDSLYSIDNTATSYIGGTRKETMLFDSGVSIRELEENLINTLQLNADGTSQPIFCLATKSLKSGGNANVAILVRWKEAI